MKDGRREKPGCRSCSLKRTWRGDRMRVGVCEGGNVRLCANRDRGSAARREMQERAEKRFEEGCFLFMPGDRLPCLFGCSCVHDLRRYRYKEGLKGFGCWKEVDEKEVERGIGRVQEKRISSRSIDMPPIGRRQTPDWSAARQRRDHQRSSYSRRQHSSDCFLQLT